MDWFTNIAHHIGSFLLIISVIVFIHEFGHYLLARLCGVRVEEFSIGFGKEIWGRNDSHGTRWKISLLPIGGFVKMFGDADPASSPDRDKLEHMSEEEKKVSFIHKPLLSKAMVVAAGPVANFILALIIFTGFFAVFGRPVSPPVVGSVMEGSAAAAADIRAGDRFISIDGTKVERFADIQRVVRMHMDGEIRLLLLRDGAEVTVSLTPVLQKSKDVFGNEVKIPLLGISSGATEYEELSLPAAVPAAVDEMLNMCADTMKALGQMVTGRRSVSELGGPIKIAQYSGQSMQQGFSTVLWFMAVLSLNLGLINLFPIPMLDGGHLLFYMVEALRGRPLAEKFQDYAFKFGFAIIITLMAFTTINDVANLF